MKVYKTKDSFIYLQSKNMFLDPVEKFLYYTTDLNEPNLSIPLSINNKHIFNDEWFDTLSYEDGETIIKYFRK